MRLSVVVTIVDGADALERCLGALANQVDPPALEVLVPWDASVPEIPTVSARFPGFRFLALGTLATARPQASEAGRHELYDRRRSAGLAAATGEIVAVLEDRGIPRPDWARTMINRHQQLPHAAIGGAIENGRQSVLHWAVYFCDFGRYQLPFEPGPRDWLSDINIGYKRRALYETQGLWRDRYHETTVHWALRRGGETLYLTPDVIVDQMRGDLHLVPLLGERLAWGRLFAETRTQETALPKRMAFALLTPFLPLLLFARLTRLQIVKRATFRKFVQVSPVVVALLIAWSIGEAWGYVAGPS